MKMKTTCCQVTDLERDRKNIEEAGRVLRAGGLVAFPTETVYGLGANALDEKAAARIYAAKGRPSDNPLIVHIAGREQLSSLVTEITETADRLMDAFWPGPMTPVSYTHLDVYKRQVLDLFRQFGPDSHIGLIAGLLVSCTETIFYTMSVYFMTAKVKKTRYTLAGAMVATLAGVIASVVIAGMIQ